MTPVHVISVQPFFFRTLEVIWHFSTTAPGALKTPGSSTT